MEVSPKTYSHYIKRSVLNDHFQCGICEGYLIDATTISECLHSFCKSCIIHFIKTIDHKCPTCNNSLDDLKSCIQFDSSLQRLIYRLVPDLLKKELERREVFAQKENYVEHLKKNSIVNIKLFNTQNDEYFNMINKLNSKENLEESSPRRAINMINALNNNRKKEVKIKYIQCVAQTPMRILIKLLRNKYSIPYNFKVNILE